MKTPSDSVYLSWTAVDSHLWDIQRFLMDRYGVDQSHRDMGPLLWFIRTGRATSEFLHLLLSAKPFMVARKLHQGGSDEEVVRRVKAYLRYSDSV